MGVTTPSVPVVHQWCTRKKNKGVIMNFVTAKELTIALDSLNEWLSENPDLRLTDIRLGKCTSKEVTFRVEYVDLRKGV